MTETTTTTDPACAKCRSVEGTQLDEKNIAALAETSLVLVMALKSGQVDAATCDRVVNPRAMVGSGVAGA